MALFKYFKPSKPSETVSSEEFNSNLNEREKDKVVKELRNIEENKKKRAEIGKYAADHGNASAVRTLGLKYPGLKRQTVSDFKLAYVKLKKSKEAEDGDITEIVKKKTGRPTLLPENLMKKVIETVASLRLKGAPVSAAVIRAVARGVIMANDRSLLLENGGYIDLSTDWSRQVLYRFEKLGQKMTSRMATTAKIPIAPALLNETKLDFQRKIKELQAWHEIDQTPLPYICTGKRTYHKQGSSNVPLVGKGKKKQITGTFAVTMTGQFLPMQLECHLHQKSLEQRRESHRAFRKSGFPVPQETKGRVKTNRRAKRNVDFRCFQRPSHGKRHKVLVHVPSNMTDHFQPLDLNVNGHAKEFLKNKFECWYAKQVTDQIDSGSNVYDVNVPLNRFTQNGYLVYTITLKVALL